jgi:hypothetical protein
MIHLFEITTKMETLNYCNECKKLLNGRSDKKFCDEGCRNNHNNRLNSIAYKNVKNINKILRINRNVLNSLLPNEDKTTVSQKTLLIRGFNFEYFTHTYQTKAGNQYYFVYEYGYLKLENNRIMIVKNKSISQ